MARRLRIQFPEAIYHLINRGNDRRDLFDTVGPAKSFAHRIGGLPNRSPWVFLLPCESQFGVSLTCNKQTRMALS